MAQGGQYPPTPVQVIVQQPRGNSAATIALICVGLGVLTCCLPIIPWVFAILGMGFGLLGVVVAFTRGGAGLLYSLFALGMSFLPLAPILLLGGLLASGAVDAARDAAEKARVEAEARPGVDVGPVVAPAAPRPAQTVQQPLERPAAQPAESPATVPQEPPAAPEPAKAVDVPPPSLRTWRDTSGKFSIEAEYAGVLAGKVILRKPDGTKTQVPLDKLSDEDRAWIEERKKNR